MSTRPECPCPKCGTIGRFLELSSASAHVDYYRCPACSHVWSVPKHECAPTRDVTVSGDGR